MKSLLGNLTSSEKFWTLMKAFLGIYKVKVDTSEVYKTGLKKGQPKFRSELRYDGVRDLLDWSIQLNAYRILLERASFQISHMYIQAIYRDASLRIEEMIILGQYYMAILGDVYDLNCKVFDRSVNHEYTLASYDIEQLVTVEVSVTLIDAESWEALTLKGLGSGQDPFDKSVAKAQTIAIKYCYLNSLAIATYDNPEADRHTDEVMQHKPASQKNNSANNLICHDCSSAISQKVADYSKSKCHSHWATIAITTAPMYGVYALAKVYQSAQT